jgi:hypothetical protein
MKVFISWSGERSKALSQALREWLPLVLHFVEPWLSQSDIEAGERWILEVSKELESSNFGIICVSKENIASPWILFEAGALAKSMSEGRVIPLLLDIDFKDIAGPLAQFQAKKVDKVGLNELVVSINNLGQGAVPESRLSQLFELSWPQLDEKVASIPKNEAASKHHRSQNDIMEELVASVRGLEMRFRDLLDDGGRTQRRRIRPSPIMMEELLHGLDLSRHDPLRILLASSILKEDYPWIYELGLDVYRFSSEGDSGKEQEARRRLFKALLLLRHMPVFEKKDFTIIRELERLVAYMGEQPPSPSSLTTPGADLDS